jgi:hypothetical protein
MTGHKPADIHRIELGKRARRAMINDRPSRSQRKSESLRVRLARGSPESGDGVVRVVSPVEVVNLRTCRDWGKPGDMRIDRTTVWGNPFRMNDDSDAERNRVCDQYIAYFIKSEIGAEYGSVGLSLKDLAGAKRLGCWCHPKRCHGDYLAMRLTRMRERGEI